MRKNITRAGVFTAGLGIAALTVTGLALPANADTVSSADETQTTVSALTTLEAFQDILNDALQASGNSAQTGDVSVDGVDGGLVNGPIVSGPVVDDVANGPILSGNDTPIASGNEVQAPIASGNDTSVDAPIGSGNEVASGNDTDTSIGDIGASVGDVVGDVSGEVDGLVSGLLD
ncbi:MULTISPECIES: hypothetical protein [unclassified Microbacterium]|uniref:hypothetical protein n=1 Tax=unclassified Microbacterium TaxID=2609290 RepID=UPI000F550477|nr:hypothetical protein [Microbacterium sp. ABRD28]AZC13278.1 hypothetical protein DT073_05735 [Microbacterium sp. ABRD28]